jgi:hypothetical protein
MSIEDLEEETETDVAVLRWSRLEDEQESCCSEIGRAGAGEIGLDEYAEGA